MMVLSLLTTVLIPLLSLDILPAFALIFELVGFLPRWIQNH